jgi:hypothetical protein
VAWGIHDVFHALLLSPYHETTTHSPNFSRPPPELIDEEEEYQVERIMGHWRTGQGNKLQYLVKWMGYPDSDNTWEPVAQIYTPDLIKHYQQQHQLSIKALRTMVQTRCAHFPKQSQPSQSNYPVKPPLSGSPHSSSNPTYNPDSSSSYGSITNLPTTSWSTPGSAKTTLAPTIILTAPRKCQPSPSILWSKHPLALRPSFGPP